MNQRELALYCARLEHDILSLQSERVSLRQREKKLRHFLYEQDLGDAQESGSQLRKIFNKVLPPHLIPGNVGAVSEAIWKFHHELEVDFGTDPSLTSLSQQSANIKVTQEAGLLLTDLLVDTNSQTESGLRGPYQVTIRDNQSSRQFNDRPIPIQALGAGSRSTSLPTPLFFLPNARVELVVSTWLPAGVTQTTRGSGQMTFLLEGVKMRVKDAQKVLSTIFSNR